MDSLTASQIAALERAHALKMQRKLVIMGELWLVR